MSPRIHQIFKFVPPSFYQKNILCDLATLEMNNCRSEIKSEGKKIEEERRKQKVTIPKVKFAF